MHSNLTLPNALLANILRSVKFFLAAKSSFLGIVGFQRGSLPVETMG